MSNLKKAHVVMSRSFLKGFGRGVVAPGLLVEDKPHRRRVDTSVERAWKDVGDALRQSMARQGAQIGEEADTINGSRRVAAE